MTHREHRLLFREIQRPLRSSQNPDERAKQITESSTEERQELKLTIEEERAQLKKAKEAFFHDIQINIDGVLQLPANRDVGDNVLEFMRVLGELNNRIAQQRLKLPSEGLRPEELQAFLEKSLTPLRGVVSIEHGQIVRSLPAQQELYRQLEEPLKAVNEVVRNNGNDAALRQPVGRVNTLIQGWKKQHAQHLGLYDMNELENFVISTVNEHPAISFGYSANRDRIVSVGRFARRFNDPKQHEAYMRKVQKSFHEAIKEDSIDPLIKAFNSNDRNAVLAGVRRLNEYIAWLRSNNSPETLRSKPLIGFLREMLRPASSVLTIEQGGNVIFDQKWQKALFSDLQGNLRDLRNNLSPTVQWSSDAAQQRALNRDIREINDLLNRPNLPSPLAVDQSAVTSFLLESLYPYQGRVRIVNGRLELERD